jgi:hypothetical protein
MIFSLSTYYIACIGSFQKWSTPLQGRKFCRPEGYGRKLGHPRWLTFNFLCGGRRGGKNRREREHCSQEMLKNCRKFIWMKICYWKFEGNLDTRVPLWAQQHMIDRHYSIFLEPWSARTLYVYAHVDLAQKYSVGLKEIFVSKLCFQEENSFFLPWGGGMEYGCFLEWPII